jgi:AcrR family transcriptional regulator
MKTGRPRQFDRDQAVRQAMYLFWENGYESTSLSQLKASIGSGITAPSFYAAFGSKEALFRETVSCYLNSHGQVTEALWNTDLAPRRAVELTLQQSASMQYEAGHPKGCMVALGVMSACSPENKPLLQLLENARQRTRAGLKRCLEEAIRSGELKSDTQVAALVVVFDSFLLGISTQARDGVPLTGVELAISQIMAMWDIHRASQA